MPPPRLSYLYKRTSGWPHSRAAYCLRAIPYIFALLVVVFSWLSGSSWLFLAVIAILIALFYLCLWAEVKLQDRQQAKASPQDDL